MKHNFAGEDVVEDRLVLAALRWTAGESVGTPAGSAGRRFQLPNWQGAEKGD